MLKTAIFHDNFAQMGGAERVTEVLHRTLPHADLLSTLTIAERISPYLRKAAPRNTWMQLLPLKKKLFRAYFMLYPAAIETVNLEAYDLIVSSCCGYAKGVKRKKGAIHVCYCHNPMRWVWRYSDYMERENFNPWTRGVLSVLVKILKQWEMRAARQPDFYIANSNIVADRLRKAFGVDSVVIPPPIDTSRFKISGTVSDYYLVLSRLVSYKRTELAVQACTRTGRKLVVIGTGPDRARLEAIAGPTVTFMGWQADEVVNRYASCCRALLFPGEEDFGMAPLEVNAAGRPVVAFAGGGALETIVEGLNGVFFQRPDVDSLIGAMERLEASTWNSQAIRQHAEKYDVSIFRQRILSFLNSCLTQEQLQIVTQDQVAA